MGLPKRGHHHCGPLLGLSLAAKVECDAVVWGRHQAQLVTSGRLHLVTDGPEVKLCNGLREGKDKRKVVTRTSWLQFISDVSVAIEPVLAL